MLYRLSYLSTPTIEFTPDELKDLVRTASSRNKSAGITGALAYDGRTFSQILEGERDDIRNLMCRIWHDPRHTGLRILEEGEVPQRLYRKWGLIKVDRQISRPERNHVRPPVLPHDFIIMTAYG
jgi:hypothetical protein